MMKAICDGCGLEGPEKWKHSVSIGDFAGVQGVIEYYEVCPDCRRRLEYLLAVHSVRQAVALETLNDWANAPEGASP